MPVNSPGEIQKRTAAGQITWTGPLIMLVARSVLAVICQALVSAVFFRGSADAWEEAGHWWRVYGTVIDVGCIVLLVWLARREGIRLFDLGNYGRERWLRDVLIGAPRGTYRTNVAGCGCIVLLRRLAAQFPSLQAGMAALRLSICQQCSRHSRPLFALPAPAPLAADTRYPLGGECDRDHHAHNHASGRGPLRAAPGVLDNQPSF